MGFQFLKREGKLVFKLVGFGTFLRSPRLLFANPAFSKKKAIWEYNGWQNYHLAANSFVLG